MARPSASTVHEAVDLRLAERDRCSECGGRIAVMCFAGTGVCSGICEKARDVQT